MSTGSDSRHKGFWDVMRNVGGLEIIIIIIINEFHRDASLAKTSGPLNSTQSLILYSVHTFKLLWAVYYGFTKHLLRIKMVQIL